MIGVLEAFMTFSTIVRIRMHDIDAAGVIFFAHQFRLMSDAFEDYIRDLGQDFSELVTNSGYHFVIVHAESDFLKPVKLGDELRIAVKKQDQSTHSFTIQYELYNGDTLVGTCMSVHVCIDARTRKKTALPDWV